jgi:xylulokinase
MPLLLGIDLGTTGCKAAVYDDQGVALGESYLEYGLITRSATMIEQDPGLWWTLTCHAVQEAWAAAGAGRREKCALAVSSQGISFLLLNSAGEALGNAINWLDTRGTAQCKRILDFISERELFQLAGKRAAPSYVLPKLLWLRDHEPERWRAATSMLMGHDFLVQRMCGAHITDHSMAGGTLLYDLAARDWSDRLLTGLDLPRTLLPAIGWAGKAVGNLSSEAAEALGLSPDTLVVLGGQDQKCAALGAGITDDTATMSLGTASALEQTSDHPIVDPAMRVPTFAFVQPARWVLEGVIGTSGGSLRWYRDTLARGTTYEVLDAEADAVAPGADGVIFLPHLSGAYSPHWQSSARGAFHGLSLATSRGHLTRARRLMHIATSSD